MNPNILSLVLLLALPLGATAQQARRPMSLHDCMEYAVSHATKMRIQQANVEDARIARRSPPCRALRAAITSSAAAPLRFRPAGRMTICRNASGRRRKKYYLCKVSLHLYGK